MTRMLVNSDSQPRFPTMGEMLSLGATLRSLCLVMVCPIFENNFTDMLLLFLMILFKRKEIVQVTCTLTSCSSSILIGIFFEKPHMVWLNVT